MRILRALPGFDLTASAFADVLPVWIQYAVVMLCVLYAFAVRAPLLLAMPRRTCTCRYRRRRPVQVGGMVSFARRLTPDDPAVAASPYGESGFYPLNFDTFGGAAVCLLTLLVEHDWPVLISGPIAAVGMGAWVYFLAFWVTCVVMVQVGGQAWMPTPCITTTRPNASLSHSTSSQHSCSSPSMRSGRSAWRCAVWTRLDACAATPTATASRTGASCSCAPASTSRRGACRAGRTFLTSTTSSTARRS